MGPLLLLVREVPRLSYAVREWRLRVMAHQDERGGDLTVLRAATVGSRGVHLPMAVARQPFPLCVA
jgi:hypothetical protein